MTKEKEFCIFWTIDTALRIIAWTTTFKDSEFIILSKEKFEILKEFCGMLQIPLKEETD